MKNHKVKLNRLAAIDLGSNSFQCLIVELDHSVKVLAEYREPVRLREGIEVNGNVSKLTSERAFQVLGFFNQQLAAFQVDTVNAVGTQAFRELSAQSLFLKTSEKILGAPIRIMNGLEEGFAIYRAILSSFPEPGEPAPGRHLIIDIGGGSSECVVGEGPLPLHGVSLPIGSVALKQLCPVNAPISVLKNYCWMSSKSLSNEFQGQVWEHCHIASGVAQILSELAEIKNQPVISFDFIERTLEQLSVGVDTPNWPLPSLTPDRRYIVVESLCLLWAIMKRLAVQEVIPSTKALRHALVLEAMTLQAPLEVTNL